MPKRDNDLSNKKDTFFYLAPTPDFGNVFDVEYEQVNQIERSDLFEDRKTKHPKDASGLNRYIDDLLKHFK